MFTGKKNVAYSISYARKIFRKAYISWCSYRRFPRRPCFMRGENCISGGVMGFNAVVSTVFPDWFEPMPKDLMDIANYQGLCRHCRWEMKASEAAKSRHDFNPREFQWYIRQVKWEMASDYCYLHELLRPRMQCHWYPPDPLYCRVLGEKKARLVRVPLSQPLRLWGSSELLQSGEQDLNSL